MIVNRRLKGSKEAETLCLVWRVTDALFVSTELWMITLERSFGCAIGEKNRYIG